VSLRNKGLNANVYVGMRYWHPYTEEALEQIKRDNVGRLVILPLYPQFSISTSGSSLRLLVRVDGGLNSTSRGAAAAGLLCAPDGEKGTAPAWEQRVACRHRGGCIVALPVSLVHRLPNGLGSLQKRGNGSSKEEKIEEDCCICGPLM